MTYAKTFAMVLATIVSALVVALGGDAVIDPVEWVNIAIAGVTALAVFTGPNVPGATITKFVLAFLGAVLTLLANLIFDGVTLSEWLQLLIAGLGAVGVYAVPNRQGPVVTP